MSSRTCSEAGCDGPHRARSYCNRHYLRWRNAGGQTNPRPPAWTADEDTQLLIAGLAPHTTRWRKGEGRLLKVARALGRTERACCDRRSRLMKRAGHAGGQWTVEGLWIEAEDDVIREEMAKGIGNADWIATGRLLGRTRSACATRACNLRKRDRLEHVAIA